jgi:hypothetical protein
LNPSSFTATLKKPDGSTFTPTVVQFFSEDQDYILQIRLLKSWTLEKGTKYEIEITPQGLLGELNPNSSTPESYEILDKSPKSVEYTQREIISQEEINQAKERGELAGFLSGNTADLMDSLSILGIILAAD